MKTFRKVSSFFLALVLLFSAVSFSFSLMVDAASTSDFEIEKGVLIKYNGTEETVTIPEGVTSIGDNAFWYKPIKEVVFPKTLKSIGNAAFYFTKISSIDIPEGVTSIGSSAFSECANLTQVKLPKSLSNISVGAFYSTPWFDLYPEDMLIVNNILVHFFDEDASSATIPQGVKTISYRAFANYGALTKITIPSSVTAIKEEAFSNSGLINMVVPNTVTVIEDRAFFGCDALESITLSSNTKHLGNEILSSCDRLKNVIIPEGVESIGDRAFAYSDRLTSLIIPNGVKSIGSNILSRCYNVKELTIPATVTKIGSDIGDIDYKDVNPLNPDKYFTIRGYNNTEAERYAKRDARKYRFVSLGDAPTTAEKLMYSGREYKGAVMMDTRMYTMAPGNIYDVGVKLLGNASTKTRRMTSSRPGIATVKQLPNGNYRITALRPGTTYITFTIYNPKDGKTVITHASIKFEIQKGVKQHGIASRQTTYFN